jgi:hypothetical protein
VELIKSAETVEEALKHITSCVPCESKVGGEIPPLKFD